MIFKQILKLAQLLYVLSLFQSVGVGDVTSRSRVSGENGLSTSSCVDVWFTRATTSAVGAL